MLTASDGHAEGGEEGERQGETGSEGTTSHLLTRHEMKCMMPVKFKIFLLYLKCKVIFGMYLC